MDIKVEDDVIDELKSANLIIPPEITITPIPSASHCENSSRSCVANTSKPQLNDTGNGNQKNNDRSKYIQLLAIIQEIRKDIRPTYTGSKSSTERLKRGIMHARVLVRECLTETEKNARQ